MNVAAYSSPSDGSKGKKAKTSEADKENEKEGRVKGEETAGGGREPPRKLLEFCERFMEFLIDLLCQLPTRLGLRVQPSDHQDLSASDDSLQAQREGQVLTAETTYERGALRLSCSCHGS